MFLRLPQNYFAKPFAILLVGEAATMFAAFYLGTHVEAHGDQAQDPFETHAHRFRLLIPSRGPWPKPVRAQLARLIEAQKQVVVGAADVYEARCRRCPEPDGAVAESNPWLFGPGEGGDEG